jgi:hypothetical protein
VANQTATVTFPFTGTWYNYLNPGTITTFGGSQSFTLNPGEYRVYVNQFVPLPASLLSFNGKNIGTVNVLNWKVANEQTVYQYEIERSSNGIDFVKIDVVNAASKTDYTFNDDVSLLSTKVFYYRIKIADTDGTYKYSTVVRLQVIDKSQFVTVMPNPFDDIIRMQINAAQQANATIVLFDMLGRKMITKNVKLSAGVNNFELTESLTLANGTYQLTIYTEKNQQTIKVVKSNKY